jgi:hypothetical protein
MPAGKGRYTIGAKGTHGCKGYPVVGGEGKVHGCHATEEEARSQQAAIYASQASEKADGCTPDSPDCGDEMCKVCAMKKTDCCPEDDMSKACWEGYVQRGMKPKDGKMVPNCIPVEKVEDYDLFADFGKDYTKSQPIDLNI